MTEKKRRGRDGATVPSQVVAAELKEKRDAFLQTFFKRGAELTDELVQRERAPSRQDRQARGRERGAQDAARERQRHPRAASKKIDELEREKARLLSTVHEQEEITAHRFAEIEAELESFANLYVASFQLHSSLARPRGRAQRQRAPRAARRRRVAGHLLRRRAERRLVPIASDGVELARAPVDRPRRGPARRWRARSSDGGRRANVLDGGAPHRRG